MEATEVIRERERKMPRPVTERERDIGERKTGEREKEKERYNSKGRGRSYEREASTNLARRRRVSAGATEAIIAVCLYAVTTETTCSAKGREKTGPTHPTNVIRNPYSIKVRVKR